MADDSAPALAPAESRPVPGLFLWGFGIALLGSLDTNGALDSRGLLLAWAGIFVAMLGLARASRCVRPRLDWLAAVAVFELAWLIFAQFQSVLPGAGWIMVLVLAALPAGYLLVRMLGHAEAAAPRLLLIVRALSLPVFLLAIVEFLLLRTRPTAVFIDANVLAALANAVFFPAFADWVSAADAPGDRPPALPRIAAVLAVVTLSVTTSLGGLLSFAAATVLFLGLARTTSVWRPAFVVLALLVGTSAIIHAYSIQRDRSSPLGRVAQEFSRTDPGRSGNVTERVAMVRSALAIYVDHHWYGTGPGTFKALYPQYRSPVDRSTLGNMVHNDYVQFLQEGGPPLLAMLVAAGFSVLLALRRLARRIRVAEQVRGSRLRDLGMATAAVAVFLHAFVNFTFYAMPLALLIGAYLALLGRDRAGREVALGDAFRPRLAWFLFGTASLVLAGTLGLRTAFSTLVADDCQLHLCKQLSRDGNFMWRFANFMSASQPSWYFADVYLARRYGDSARKAVTPAERENYAEIAMREWGSVATKAPMLSDSYQKIADLLLDFPGAASALPAGVPRDREALYLKAVHQNPLDFAAASSAAELMAQRGAAAEAFQLLLEVRGFWYTAMIEESDRTKLLVTALPLALQLGRCEDALQISSTLLQMKPQDALAAGVQASLSAPAAAATATLPGCGVKLPAPEPQH